MSMPGWCYWYLCQAGVIDFYARLVLLLISMPGWCYWFICQADVIDFYARLMLLISMPGWCYWLLCQAGVDIKEVQEMVESHLKEMIIRTFDPKKADSIFSDEGEVWLELLSTEGLRYAHVHYLTIDNCLWQTLWKFGMYIYAKQMRIRWIDENKMFFSVL